MFNKQSKNVSNYENITLFPWSYQQEVFNLGQLEVNGKKS